MSTINDHQLPRRIPGLALATEEAIGRAVAAATARTSDDIPRLPVGVGTLDDGTVLGPLLRGLRAL
ncbi:hypothetical protein, partial [Amycolatopsis vastitatis]|uniref:hypothetical protein n=1 Tax=Amycolatopsis vastitatis TaxID=1905142 RepID=UPI00196B85D1